MELLAEHRVVEVHVQSRFDLPNLAHGLGWSNQTMREGEGHLIPRGVEALQRLVNATASHLLRQWLIKVNQLPQRPSGTTTFAAGATSGFR